MKILLVSATPFEMAPTLEYLESMGAKKSFFEFEYEGKQIFPLVTGVGSMRTAFALARYTEIKEVDVALHIGVAGAFSRKLALGDVVEVEADRMADLGVEEADGKFTDVFEMELAQANDYLHQGGWIMNTEIVYHTGLPKVRGLTVNTVTGTQASIDALQAKYSADIETMEGAAFLYACKSMDVKHLALRGISNYVEPRNRVGWQLEDAINNVNSKAIEVIKSIAAPQKKRPGFSW